MKENFCFDSERDRMEHCSLKMVSESFMIGRVTIQTVHPGDSREGQKDVESSESFFVKTYASKKSLTICHQEDSAVLWILLHVSNSLPCYW